MLIKVLKSKVHRATVTQANADYLGSISIDRKLCEAVGLVPGEAVLVAVTVAVPRFMTTSPPA